MRNRRPHLERMIFEVLFEAALQNEPNQTLWMDADTIAWVTLDSKTRKTRRMVLETLRHMERRQLVQSRRFDEGLGWKVYENEV